MRLIRIHNQKKNTSVD